MAELNELMSEDNTVKLCDPMDVMSRCGVKTVLNVSVYCLNLCFDDCILIQLSTKSLIAQDIATYEGLYKITHLLDQFCDGLKKAGILEVIRAFPDMFLPLFVYKKLTAVDVLAAVYVSPEQGNSCEEEMLLGYFNQFILECDETGNYLHVYVAHRKFRNQGSDMILNLVDGF